MKQWSKYFWDKVAKMAKKMSYADAYTYYRQRYQQTGLTKYIEPIS